MTSDDISLPSQVRSTLDRWWVGDPAERYWLEVSERDDDLGIDLNAPTTNEVGRPFWSYDLLQEVAEGDVVLHYDRGTHVGSAWHDLVVWAARGTFARGRNIQPHERPGRRVSLRGPFRLAEELPLSRIRDAQERLAGIRQGRPYFPFELGKRDTRPIQGYLFKLPAAFLELFAELDEVPREMSSGLTMAQLSPETGALTERETIRPTFRPRNESVRSRGAQPWSRDPSEVDRALSAHARIERLVADAAVAAGWEPKAYAPDDPVFDLLLERATGIGPLVVVEAKSTIASNEEKQLRLALGQVMRYRQLLRRPNRHVIAMIAVERPPTDSRWSELCAEADVMLVWPEVVERELTALG